VWPGDAVELAGARPRRRATFDVSGLRAAFDLRLYDGSGRDSSAPAHCACRAGPSGERRDPAGCRDEETSGFEVDLGA
jgi:hypothetical protein